MVKKKQTRLGKLLLDAGLLTEDQRRRVEQEYQKSETAFTDILFQQVSLKTFKELLFYEIPLPGGKKESNEIRDELIKEGIFTEEELEQLLVEYKPKEVDLGESLIQAGFITPDQFAEARAQMEITQLPLARVLINLKYITPKTISDIVKYQQQLGQEQLIGRLLVRQGLLSEQKFKEALKKRILKKQPLGLILVEEKYLTAQQVQEAFDKFLEIPYVDLTKYEIDPDAVKLLPETLVREKNILPIKKESRELHLATLDPLDQSVLDDVALLTGCKILPVLVDESALIAMIERCFPKEEIRFVAPQIPESKPENIEITKQTGKEKAEETLVTPQTLHRDRAQIQGLEGLVGSTTTVNLVNSIISTALRSRATDIHIEPQIPKMRIRYRIDGMLYDVMTLNTDQELPVISRVKVLANMDITERRRPQDGHLGFSFEGKTYDIRVATLPTNIGEKLVMRLLDEATVLKGLSQLGFEPDELQTVKEMCKRPYGMVLVTGPIGSGKTTTLYSAMNEINVMTSNIVTIEDPIEYQMPGINQVNVDPKIDLTFATGLRAIMRQDVNVMMVGEIRDAETASIAVRAAMTGHLLFSTLHTNDSVGAITTLQHFGIQPFLAASGLIGVIAQRLIRTICPHCKQPYSPDLAERSELGLSGKDKATIYKGAGCEACFRTGFLGRSGIFEVLRLDERLRGLIVENTPEATLRETAIQQGMRTLKMSAVQKVLNGITTVDELIRVMYI